MRKTSQKATHQEPVSRAPQRERGRHRVEALMASAAALFVEKGFEATTMTEIATGAGASIGSLYLFFPTKEALGHAMLVERAEELSARLEVMRTRVTGLTPAAVADALFGELEFVMTAHPVYAVLADLPGDEVWRKALRIKRRGQIAALFAAAKPALPQGQAERLAVIVPQFIRMSLTFHGEASLRAALLEELRLMLHRHLEESAATLKTAKGRSKDDVKCAIPRH